MPGDQAKEMLHNVVKSLKMRWVPHSNPSSSCKCQTLTQIGTMGISHSELQATRALHHRYLRNLWLHQLRLKTAQCRGGHS